jgi:DnaJ-domain-containing protein 1
VWKKKGKSKPPANEPGGTFSDPRRRTERHLTESLACDLGTVIDLSAAGMRVAFSGKPPLEVGQSGKVRLRIPEGSLPVTGRAVWLRRTGFRKFEMGIEFFNVKRSISAALDSLARFGFLGMGTAASAGGSPAGDGDRKKRGHAAVRATIELPDYYRVLQVAPEASDDEIRDAFRSMARRFHPDVSKETDAQERFIQIHEAYDVLKDPDRRKNYDMRKAG